MPTYATPEPIAATIDLPVVGDVRVTASDRTDTVVQVSPRHPSKAADVRAAEQTTVEYADGRLRVRAARHWSQHLPFGDTGAIEVTVELPTGSSLEGDLAMGRVLGEGELGKVQVTTAMGDIRLDHTGPLGLKTAFGNITVDRATGDVEAGTSSGAVRIGTIEGTAVLKNSNGDTAVGAVTGAVRAKSANGDVTIERAHDSVSARTANGDISVGRADGSVSAKTSRGDVRIGEVSQGTTVAETAAGEVEVGIGPGVSAWLDLRSSHGDVRNGLDEADGPETPERTVEVRAHTSIGDILIHRARTQTVPSTP
ncbi:MAG TPA: DUF4097 family beta strand repeat-containing protein [Iamia sp.]|nr:DUF4097 family beta strand repeat-containing protein [Iamia sp.]